MQVVLTTFYAAYVEHNWTTSYLISLAFQSCGARNHSQGGTSWLSVAKSCYKKE